MRENKIIIEPFQFISYLDLTAFKSVGSHTTVKVKGIINEESADKYLGMARDDVWIKIILQSDNVNMIFFQGIVIKMQIKNENGVHIMEFEAKSGSYLLDCGQHIRSFQSEGISYLQMINTCLQSYAGSSCNIEPIYNIKIQDMILQYRESDWEFIHRLAAKQNTVAYPDNRNVGIRINFGISEKVNTIVIESNDYMIEKDSTGYTYIVSDRENHELGDCVIFLGIRLCIYQIITQMKGNELYHKYYLKRREEIKEHLYKNEKIQGASLQAIVANVKGDMVQVKIVKDENAENAGYRWYTYATVYSTPDGTGWYCMPEIGDRVRLMFPDLDEKNAYVVSSVHMESGQERGNPDNKSFMNKQRKEILFTPDAIILRNNNGITLEMKDEEGIKLISNKDIILQAEENITVSSKSSNISMEADKALSLKQGNTSFCLSNTIKMSGGKINMN
mgnify:CR=1 FL=1